MDDRNAIIKGPYHQRSVIARIEAFFLDNLAKVATREQLIEVATDPSVQSSSEEQKRQVFEFLKQYFGDAI